MFTGIITDIGTLRRVESRDGARLEIGCGYDLGDVEIGASIACAGVCLTVVDKSPEDGWFAVDVSGETLSKTHIGDWSEGRRINLERALRVGDELGGHIVSGHVDAVAEVVETMEEGESTRVLILAPTALAPYIAAKGSVALDGCSLTVNGVEDADAGVRFDVNLIPHTKRETSFSGLAAGDRLNIEIDLLARYVARLKETL